MVANMREGAGVFHWGDGSVFKGTFKADKRHGYGVLTTADGQEYSGTWDRDVKHGQGTLKHSGKVLKVAW